MSELTLTVMRLGLLVALWVFVFAIVGVLRGDLYGTRVTARSPRRAARRAAAAGGGAAVGAAGSAGAAGAAGAGAGAPGQATPPRVGIFGRRRTGPRKLTVTAGPLVGTSLPLRAQGTLIGRAPECALVLDDDYASGRHARIYHDGVNWVVEDLRSTNGTWLDGQRLGADPRPVAEGSSLRIGRTTIELQR